MKPILPITEEIFDIVSDDNLQRKKKMLFMAQEFSIYNIQYPSIIKGILSCITINTLYILSFFKVVSYLYEYYEFSQKHFDLLNYAATHLVELYSVEMQKTCGTEKAEQNVYELKAKLADYLYMTAMTFQTAADKTENTELALIYRAKAEEYCQKADALLGIAAPQDYLVKMQQLYQQYSQKEKIVYVQELLAYRAHEYQVKIEEKTHDQAPRSAASSFSSRSSSFPPSPQFFAPPQVQDERQPLLARRHPGVNADPFALDS